MMSTPNPGSATEWLISLADSACEHIDALLSVSTLIPLSGYYEWRVLAADKEPLRYRALKALNAFGSGLEGILGRHDPTRLHALQYEAAEAYRLVEQRAHTGIETISDAKSKIFAYIAESLDALPRLDDPFDGAVLVIPDTSALIDFPNLDDYHVGFPSVRLP